MAALAVVVRQFLQHVHTPRQPPQFHGFAPVVLRGFDVRHAFYGGRERGQAVGEWLPKRAVCQILVQCDGGEQNKVLVQGVVVHRVAVQAAYSCFITPLPMVSLRFKWLLSWFCCCHCPVVNSSSIMLCRLPAPGFTFSTSPSAGV